jgi:hypothetical protein
MMMRYRFRNAQPVPPFGAPRSSCWLGDVKGRRNPRLPFSEAQTLSRGPPSARDWGRAAGAARRGLGSPRLTPGRRPGRRQRPRTGFVAGCASPQCNLCWNPLTLFVARSRSPARHSSQGRPLQGPAPAALSHTHPPRAALPWQAAAAAAAWPQAPQLSRRQLSRRRVHSRYNPAQRPAHATAYATAPS